LLFVAVDRCAVGQAHVGRLVGLGCAADFRVDFVVFVLGYMALTRAIDDPRRADRAGAVVALVGVVNVPIIYFSVQWWNTLHQGASVSLTKSPSMAAVMLWAMLVMTLAFWAYAVGMAFYRVRQTILEREQDAAWVGELKEIAP